MDGFIDTILNGLFDIIQSALEIALGTFLGRVLYFAETGLCKIVAMLDQMFQVFAGITKVSYDGEADYLINIFFNNRSITNIYWGMALIGIALAFGFAIAAAVRKMFDSGGKQQQSLGQLVTALLRTIFLILGMTAIMVVILNSTNILMQQINYIFNDPTNLDLPETIVYTDEDYAAMGRVLNTIGNYSLNPSYSSRYNINTCFNEVRQDLYYLQQRNVFRYYYTTTDSDGNEVNTWQSVLQRVANSHDLRSDLKLDVSYDAVNTALLSAMDIIRNDASFRPLESYTRVVPAEGTLPLDRYVFLMGTMHAAKNGAYNENPELTDAVRGPYYSGEKSIYSISSVSSDFDIGYATDYIIVFCACIALIFDLVTIILNCIARIFNMLFLYLIAPPVFATQPFDGGGKTKQWLTAFIVQTFSAFGTVIAMRLLLVMLPIVTSSKLVLFENGLMNAMAKLVMIYGLFEVAKKATGLLTGILADSAGWQSVQAGDMSGSANRLVGGVAGAAKAVGGAALKATGKVADVATKPVQNLAKRGYNATIGKAAQAWNDLGKGDVGGQKAMTAAKERLATEQAYAKLTGGAAPGGGSGSGGGAGVDSGGAVSSTLNAGGKVAGGLGSTAASMAGHGDDLPGPSGGGSPAGGGDDGGSLPAGSGGGTAGGGEGGQTGGGSPGGGAAKTPPPLPGKQGGGGKQPLSAGAQNLFGTDASGKKRPRETPASSGSRPTLGPKPEQGPRSKEAPTSSKRPSLSSFSGGGGGKPASSSSGGKSGGGGGQKPLGVKAQNLFGTDASGKKTFREAPAATGSRPTLGSVPKQSGPSREAPTPGRRPTLDGSGGGGEKPPPAGEGQKTPPSAGGASGGATTGSGQKQYSEAAQRLFGVDASGQVPPRASTGGTAPRQPGGGVSGQSSGTPPRQSGGAAPGQPSSAPPRQSGGAAPGQPSGAPPRQSGGEAPRQSSGGASSGGQKQYSEAAQKLFEVDASGQATPRQSSGTAPKAPPKAQPPKPPRGGGLPGNMGGK